MSTSLPKHHLPGPCPTPSGVWHCCNCKGPLPEKGHWLDGVHPAQCSTHHYWQLQVHNPWQCHQTPQEDQATTPARVPPSTLPVWLVVVVPALPPDQFLTTQNPGSLIRAQQQPDCITTNTIGDYIRNNNTDNILPRCNKDQLRNSFFVKTATNWSLEMESPGQRHHPRRLCPVYQPHTSRPPMHGPYSG